MFMDEPFTFSAIVSCPLIFSLLSTRVSAALLLLYLSVRSKLHVEPDSKVTEEPDFCRYWVVWGIRPQRRPKYRPLRAKRV